MARETSIVAVGFAPPLNAGFTWLGFLTSTGKWNDGTELDYTNFVEGYNTRKLNDTKFCLVVRLASWHYQLVLDASAKRQCREMGFCGLFNSIVNSLCH